MEADPRSLQNGGVHIRYQTELSSLDGYWQLYEGTGWNREYRIVQDDLAVVLQNSWYLIAAYEGDRLVSFGRIVTDGLLHAMVYDLITDPDYQGRGIGGEVLRRLVAKCREAGIREIQLFSAAGKREFYQKRGFRPRDAESPGMEYVSTEAGPG